MLVKEDVVKQWYKKDHWIYKNFCYIFQNELWNKPVPRGFSVCPYFWMAVLLSPALRLFVAWPVKYVISPVPRLFGMERLDDYLIDVFYEYPTLCKRWSGIGIGMLFLLFAGIVLFAIGIGGYILWAKGPVHWRATCLGAGDTEGASAATLLMLAVASIAPLLIGIVAYKNKRPDGKCKPEVYIYLWGLAFGIAAVMMLPDSLLELGATTIGFFAWLLSTIAHAIASAISWLAAVCWDCIKWLFIRPLVFGLPPFFAVAIPWLAMFLVSWLLQLQGKSGAKAREEAETEEEATERRFHAWRSAMSTDVSLRYGRKAIAMMSLDDDEALMHELGHDNLARLLGWVIVDKLSDKLDEAARIMSNFEMPCHYQQNVWRDRVERAFENSNCGAAYEFRRAWEIIFDATAEAAENREDLLAAVRSRTDELEKYRRDRERKLARQQRWDRLCERVTAPLAFLFVPFAAIGKVAKLLMTFAVNVITYLRVLVVAKKQKACPYFRFEDK